MVCESYISHKLLNFPLKNVEKIKNTVLSIYEKVDILNEDFSAIMNLLKHDKKNVNGQVNFVLLNNFEDFKIDCKVPNDLIIESIRFYNA